MKTTLLSLATLLFSFSLYASQDRGGGDLCEKRIQEVRDDLVTWIEAGGAENMALPEGLSTQEYSQRMLEAMATTAVKCIGKGDAGHPLFIVDSRTQEQVPKVCVWDRTTSPANITCDHDKFNSMNSNEESQYVLIHHEYAGIAGIESPDGAVSRYEISDQIALFLENRIVKRLAVKKPNFEVNGNPSTTLKKLYDEADRAAIVEDFKEIGQVSDLKCTFANEDKLIKMSESPMSYTYKAASTFGPAFTAQATANIIMTPDRAMLLAEAKDYQDGLYDLYSDTGLFQHLGIVYKTENTESDLVVSASTTLKGYQTKQSYRVNGGIISFKQERFLSGRTKTQYGYCWKDNGKTTKPAGLCTYSSPAKATDDAFLANGANFREASTVLPKGLKFQVENSNEMISSETGIYKTIRIKVLGGVPKGSSLTAGQVLWTPKNLKHGSYYCR